MVPSNNQCDRFPGTRPRRQSGAVFMAAAIDVLQCSIRVARVSMWSHSAGGKRRSLTTLWGSGRNCATQKRGNSSVSNFPMPKDLFLTTGH